jgi:hypothetical protein
MSRNVFDGHVIGHQKITAIKTSVGGQGTATEHHVTVAMEPDGLPLYEVILSPAQAVALANELLELAKS